jgi:hypothetical protein
LNLTLLYAGEFDDVLDSSSSKCISSSVEEISLTYCDERSSLLLESNGSILMDRCQKVLDLENLTLQTPTSKAILIRDLSLVINKKDHLLVCESICIFISLNLTSKPVMSK